MLFDTPARLIAAAAVPKGQRRSGLGWDCGRAVHSPLARVGTARWQVFFLEMVICKSAENRPQTFAP
jgi:hypothetical protein